MVKEENFQDKPTLPRLNRPRRIRCLRNPEPTSIHQDSGFKRLAGLLLAGLPCPGTETHSHRRKRETGLRPALPWFSTGTACRALQGALIAASVSCSYTGPSLQDFRPGLTSIRSPGRRAVWGTEHARGRNRSFGGVGGNIESQRSASRLRGTATLLTLPRENKLPHRCIDL